MFETLHCSGTFVFKSQFPLPYNEECEKLEMFKQIKQLKPIFCWMIRQAVDALGKKKSIWVICYTVAAGKLPSNKCCTFEWSSLLFFPQVVISNPILKLLQYFLERDSSVIPNTVI